MQGPARGDILRPAGRSRGATTARPLWRRPRQSSPPHVVAATGDAPVHRTFKRLYRGGGLILRHIQHQPLVTCLCSAQGPGGPHGSGPQHNGSGPPDGWKGSNWRGPFNGPGSAGVVHLLLQCIQVQRCCRPLPRARSVEGSAFHVTLPSCMMPANWSRNESQTSSWRRLGRAHDGRHSQPPGGRGRGQRAAATGRRLPQRAARLPARCQRPDVVAAQQRLARRRQRRRRRPAATRRPAPRRHDARELPSRQHVVAGAPHGSCDSPGYLLCCTCTYQLHLY